MKSVKGTTMSSNEQDYWSGVIVVACDKRDEQSFLMVGINNNCHIAQF